MARGIKKNGLKADANLANGDGRILKALENMQGEIKSVSATNAVLVKKMDIVIDGQQALGQRMDSIEVKVGSLETEVHLLGARVGKVEGRIDSMEAKMDSMEDEMHTGFKTVIEELDKKADKADLIILDRRVTKLEAAK